MIDIEDTQHICGTFVTSIYESDDYSVNVFRCDGKDIKVVGDGIPHIKSLSVSFTGNWEKTKYGNQFKVVSYDVDLPTTEDGVIAYFKMLKCGIGKTIASRIYARHGIDTFKVIENEPELLLEIKGVGNKQLKNLKRKYEETRMLRNVMLLCENKLTPTYALKAIQKFRGSVLDIIQNSIYKLCEVPGIGFTVVEALAISRGDNLKTKERIIHALYHLEAQHKQSGHVCYPRQEMVNELYLLLNAHKETISVADLKELLKTIFTEKTDFVVNGPYIYSYKTLYEERVIASRLVDLKHSAFVIPHLIAEESLNEVCKNINFELAPEQKTSVLRALEDGVSVITGGPGTGKSTVLLAVLKAYKRAWNIINKTNDEPRICLLAPTGRASKRMVETTGLPASTIHSRIGLYSDDVKADIDIDADLVIVDEASMIDQHLMYSLLDNIQPGTIVLLVGDANQLPSVGAGNVFADIINSKVVTITELKLVFRQGQQSAIHLNAEKVKNGHKNLKGASDFRFIRASSNQNTDIACKLYKQAIDKVGIDNVILLCPYRKCGEVCCNSINKRLQQELNERRQNEQVIVSHDVEFRIRDRVMQCKNMETVKNGDIGTITDIQYLRAEEIAGMNGVSEESVDSQVCAIIDFDGVEYAYTKEMMTHIDLAYCMSVHKSQGSEYKIVIMITSLKHRALLSRRLFYTAITRASKMVFLVGEEGAVKYAIDNNAEEARYTNLAETLQLKGGTTNA